MATIKIDGYEKYSSTVETADGKKIKVSGRDKGDEVAVALRGVDANSLRSVMAENGLGEEYDALAAERTKNDDDGNEITYTLNPGQVRMLAGQKLRALMRKDGSITINGNTIDAPAEEPKEETAAA